jgi:hypothetical protein
MAQLYICSLPNPGTAGVPHECFYSDDDAGRERARLFAERENRPGRGVYDCIGKLKDGVKSRCKDNVAELDNVIVDLDLKNIVEPRNEVIKVLQGLLLPPTEIRDSGFGLHAVWQFKEAVNGEAGLKQAEDIMAGLVRLLAGDPAPTHRAALLRHLGSDNTKEGEPRPCRVLERNNQQYDVSEFGDLLDACGDQAQLTAKPKPATNGHDRTAEGKRSGPVDVDAELASIHDGASANDVQPRVIPPLLRKMHPDEVLNYVVDGTMAARRRPAKWTREREVIFVRSRILSAYNNLLLKDYDSATGVIPDWLPGEFHRAWIDRLQQGRRPCMGFNPGGFYVRSQEQAGDRQPRKKKDHAGEGTSERPKQEQSKAEQSKQEQPKATAGKGQPSWPTPYSGRAAPQIPRRSFAMGQHYIIGATSITASAGGVGKSTLSLLDAVSFAIGRNLLTGEILEKRRRVWVWNAEDDIDEMERRLTGICIHYNIDRADLVDWIFLDSGYDLPLDLAHGNGKGPVMQEELINLIAERVTRRNIEIVILDPLVALHSMSEGDNPGHAKLIRTLSTKVAKPCNCAIDIDAHTRKPGTGQDTITIDDVRGAGSIIYSARSGRILHTMSLAEAEKYNIDAEDRLTYYRLERGKANMAKRGTVCWVHMIEVPIPNCPDGAYGDTMAVPIIWTPPDAMAGVTDTVANAIAGEIAKGEYKRDARAGASWAGRLVGLRCGIDTGTKSGKDRAKVILETLIKKGALAVEIRTDKNRNAREYVVPGVLFKGGRGRS